MLEAVHVVHVPAQATPVPATPAPLGHVHVPAPVQTDVMAEAQYATQAFTVPSLTNGCSRSCGVINITTSS